MSIFDKLTGGLFADTPSFNPKITKVNQGMQDQWRDDIGGVRSLANDQITGLSMAGQAGQDLSQTAYHGQLDQNRLQQGSQLASSMANASRLGMDSGASERMANNSMRQGMIGQQQLGQANVQNQANIGMQDLQTQQRNQNTALMALSPMQQGMVSSDFKMRDAGNQAMNKAAAANMAAEQASNQAFLNAGASVVGGAMSGGLFG